ncbi:hypothetical protein FE257_005469 [Aspergillus nanangensis]|uniref:Response regulatory domain-containing protein n=1 Tax=Aspergillus nanangensis TaxID=2582783 RepID=A0AAD4GWV1_ASPNN|nr:hypothetical protein FE257_005469 [Aspergillus nanangensis]
MHILVVEDNWVNQKLISRLLSRFHCTESKAYNGQEALDYLADPRHRKPDIIFLDVAMPVMGGQEVLQILRTQRPFVDDPILQNTPVIIMTAHKMLGDNQIWISRGASDVLSKPMRQDFLRRMLLRWSRREVVPAVPGGNRVVRRPVWGPMPLRAYRGPRSLL